MNMCKRLSAMLGVPLLLCGCANEPTLTERNFGDSVRQMIQAQTYDASTLESPSTEPVEGADGRRTENVLETYRNDVYKPAAAGSNEIALGVSEGR
jgi:PBP1b-binding outer membrane lipoprotein LpoB